MKLTCYLNPRKSNAERMLRAVHDGAIKAGHDCAIETVRPGLHVRTDRLAVFYGVDEVTFPLWRETNANCVHYFYVDNGYFKSKWKGGDFYRITKDRIQHQGIGNSFGARWEELGIEMHPGRTPRVDAPVMLALQSDWWYRRFGTTKEAWIAWAVDQMQPILAGRRILIRDKSEHSKPINWQDVHAVVAHSSNVLVDGLIEGVPVFAVYGDCAARHLSGTFPRVDMLRRPSVDERLRWARVLADNQWVVDEIEAGVPWEKLA